MHDAVDAHPVPDTYSVHSQNPKQDTSRGSANRKRISGLCYELVSIHGR